LPSFLHSLISPFIPPTSAADFAVLNFEAALAEKVGTASATARVATVTDFVSLVNFTDCLLRLLLLRWRRPSKNYETFARILPCFGLARNHFWVHCCGTRPSITFCDSFSDHRESPREISHPIDAGGLITTEQRRRLLRQNNAA